MLLRAGREPGSSGVSRIASSGMHSFPASWARVPAPPTTYTRRRYGARAQQSWTEPSFLTCVTTTVARQLLRM